MPTFHLSTLPNETMRDVVDEPDHLLVLARMEDGNQAKPKTWQAEGSLIVKVSRTLRKYHPRLQDFPQKCGWYQLVSPCVSLAASSSTLAESIDASEQHISRQPCHPMKHLGHSDNQDKNRCPSMATCKSRHGSSDSKRYVDLVCGHLVQPQTPLNSDSHTPSQLSNFLISLSGYRCWNERLACPLRSLLGSSAGHFRFRLYGIAVGQCSSEISRGLGAGCRRAQDIRGHSTTAPTRHQTGV